MPGRRKRRKSRKQSLVFTESPVHNQRHVPTPVLCVDNPVTAKVVPVEADQTWVSPQFREIRSAKRDNRRVRKYHSTIVTRSRHPSNKENASAINEFYRNKYKSLKFLGESSDEASSDNISFDSPTPANADRRDKTSSVTSIVNSSETWSLRKLKNSRRSFEVSFTESLNVRTPIRHHDNHSLNVTSGSLMTTVKTRVRRKDNESGNEGVCVTNTEVHTTPPRSRRSARLQSRLNVLFGTPPQKKKTVEAEVLVCDTPESEYGLSIRDRRLKRLNKSRP